MCDNTVVSLIIMLGTAAALKAFDKIIMRSFESIDVRACMFVHQYIADKVIDNSKLSISDEIEMKKTVLLETRNNISMDGVGVFGKVLRIFHNANQNCAEFAEHMKSM